MKVALAIIAAVVLLALVLAGYMWWHPMTVFNAANRRTLKNAGFTRTEVKTPVGIQVAWEAGDGPALVLLHGAGDQAGTWSKVAPAFTSMYRVVVLDIAGHGDSEPQGGTIAVDAMLSGVESVIEQRAGSPPVTLVGNSMGAWLAMLYAQKHSDHVSRIVLVNGGPLSGERPDLAFLPQNREEMRRFFENILDAGSPRPPDYVLDDLVRQMRHGPLARMAGADDWLAYLMEGRLTEFSTPVDLLWGESDRLVPLTYAIRMKAQLPAVRMTSIPRCGHVPQQECPQAFTAKLKEVLALPAPEPLRKAPGVVKAVVAKE